MIQDLGPLALEASSRRAVPKRAGPASCALETRKEVYEIDNENDKNWHNRYDSSNHHHHHHN